MLKIHGITVSYNGASVLQDFSFEISPGDFVAIVGPNGCGKTTLLRAMLGYLRPRTGTVMVEEERGQPREVHTLPARKRAQKFAAVRQEDETSFDFTVEELVRMGRTPYVGRFGLLSARDRQIAEEAMRVTDIYHLRHRLITEVSGGERRRVAIARAVAQEPQILLLDEPTANLDLNYQQEMIALAQELNRKRNVTIVVAIHEINLASIAAKTLLLLNRSGQIHAHGNASEVLTADNIEAVYGIRAAVISHPLSGHPQVLPSMNKISQTI